MRHRLGKTLVVVVICLGGVATNAAGHTTVAGKVRLIDGSVSPPVPRALSHIAGSAVMTKVIVLRARQLRRQLKTCYIVPLKPDTVVVERVGINGRDLTFETPFGDLGGCDRNPKANGHPWCGKAGGPLVHGRILDPRLDVCENQSGAVVAFAWIDPSAAARWIVVVQPGHREIYPVAAGLPVRVTTTSHIHALAAKVTYAAYTSNGHLIGWKTVSGAVAG